MHAQLSRRSTAFIIFEQLQAEIMSIDLLPLQKLSETEVAARFGVSRQPVREAFQMLANLDLVEIQPKKATRVSAFSISKIVETRFARLAMEIEVSKCAQQRWSNAYQPAFQRCLDDQDKAIAASDALWFHRLDANFHGLIARVAQLPFALALAQRHNVHLDRICALCLDDANEMSELTSDHRRIYHHIVHGDSDVLEDTLRTHLSRVEKTITAAQAEHPNYFRE